MMLYIVGSLVRLESFYRIVVSLLSSFKSPPSLLYFFLDVIDK